MKIKIYTSVDSRTGKEIEAAKEIERFFIERGAEYEKAYLNHMTPAYKDKLVEHWRKVLGFDNISVPVVEINERWLIGVPTKTSVKKLVKKLSKAYNDYKPHLYFEHETASVKEDFDGRISVEQEGVRHLLEPDCQEFSFPFSTITLAHDDVHYYLNLLNWLKQHSEKNGNSQHAGWCSRQIEIFSKAAPSNKVEEKKKSIWKI